MYEIYAIDPNGDDFLVDSADTRQWAIKAWCNAYREFKGSGCSIEIWRDGEPLTETPEEFEAAALEEIRR